MTTEIAIFGFGGIIFIITTWATVAFGVRRMYELQREDLNDSPRIKEIKEEGFTEVYITNDLESDRAPRPATLSVQKAQADPEHLIA